MLRPYKGRVYDPCCGSSGMFVQSEEFIRAHGGRIGDISIYGQELNYTTWRLAKMNLAIRGIDGRIEQGDLFTNDRFPDLKADYILANPPFNMKSWGGEHLREDKRWKYGVPPMGNANFAWVQHKLAEYLQSEFPCWHVVCEYKRRHLRPRGSARQAASSLRPFATKGSTPPAAADHS